MKYIYVPNSRKPIKKGVIRLLKLDACNCGKRLNSALFDLYKFNEEKKRYDRVLEGLCTDKDGMIIVDDMSVGSYQFYETVAPAGYNRNTAPIDVQIWMEGNEIKVEPVLVIVCNKAIPINHCKCCGCRCYYCKCGCYYYCNYCCCYHCKD